MEVSILTESSQATKHFGESIGRKCSGGELILLLGDFGSGKTCFTQGLALGLDLIDTNIVSPTFNLHVEYFGRLKLNHLDLYRLTDFSESSGLGLDELLTDKQAVTVIEWAEILPIDFINNSLLVSIDYIDINSRRFRVSSKSHDYTKFFANL